MKRLNKIEKKTLKPNDVLKKATANINLQPTGKYGVPPEEVEKKLNQSEEYRLTYDFSRLKKVDKNAERYSRYDRESDKKAKKKLHSPLVEGELVYLLSCRLKEKTPIQYFIKAPRKVTRRFKNHRGTEFYRMQEVDSGKKVEGRFLRKELFALKSNVQ